MWLIFRHDSARVRRAPPRATLAVFALAAGMAAPLRAQTAPPAAAAVPAPSVAHAAAAASHSLAASPAPAALAASASSAQATPGGAMAALVAQGKYWQSQGRDDLATGAWQRVLKLDPDQPDALYGLGVAGADAGHLAQARGYLARLRAVAPHDPRIDDLASRTDDNPARASEIARARALAQSGQGAAAAAEYQHALDGQPASPQLRLEYYQALATTPKGWDEARHGLEQLVHDFPDEPRYALALAQHLTYRDVTRRDGIARLQTLAAGTGPTHADALKSWRQALLWLDARPSDAPTYQAYLQLAPGDTVVKARFASAVQQYDDARARAAEGAAASARGRAITEGFAALDHNDTATARARFSSVLAAHPDDADALGGLGLAALKDSRFAEARDDLERASRGGNAARWKSALNSATYWYYTSEALGARSNGDPARAKTLFERAIALDPSDVSAQVMLGEMLLANGDAAGAEQAYRMALRRQADNPDAMRGLVGALAAQGRGDEAMQFAGQLTLDQQTRAGGIDRLRGDALAAEARAAEARGDLGTARSLFEQALPTHPDDAWMRLDLARIYVREGATGQARSMMDDLLAAHPDMPEALYAGALLAEQTQDWSDGLRLLDRIPAGQRTESMRVLQHRLWVHQQADLAQQWAHHGNVAQAAAILAAAEPVAAGDPGMTGALAGEWAQLGNVDHALAMMRAELASAPTSTDLLIQYANVLLTAGQDAELGNVMRRVSAAQLTPDQRADVDRLNLAIVVHQTDTVRQQGDLASAYDVLAPWLAAMPDNPDLQAALARLYTAADESANALASYRVALAHRPGDPGLQLPALYAASAAGDFAFADRLAAQLLQASPDDPGVLAAAGRLYRAEGKLSLAADYLRRALVAAHTAPRSVTGANASAPPRNVPRNWAVALQRIGATPLPGTNPFTGKRAVGQPNDRDADDLAPTAPATGFSPSS